MNLLHRFTLISGLILTLAACQDVSEPESNQQESKQTTEPTVAQNEPVSTAPQSVNLYSARKAALIEPLLNEFTAETGIKVNLISSKADALLKRIENEGDNSPADVLLTTDAGRLHRAKQAGIFAAIHSKKLDAAVPEHYRDPDNQWYGLSVRVRSIMVTEAGKAFNITRYEDLAKPDIGQQICIRSSNNIYNQSLVAGMLAQGNQTDIENWAKSLVVNMARNPQGGDRDQIRAAAAGQCSIVVANTYYLANMLSDQDNIRDFEAASAITVIWPNQKDRGAHANVSGAGVLKTAPNKDNAIKLIEFLASDKAQQIYANVNYEYPVKHGVALNPILENWGKFNADPLPLSKLGEFNASAVMLMDRAGWQ